MIENKRFISWGNRIKRNGKLLNIEFKTKTDAKLCCKLCNQMDKHQQEYINELNEIFKWYKDYYGETILDTRMGWNDDNKIAKLEKENEQLKKELESFKPIIFESDGKPVTLYKKGDVEMTNLEMDRNGYYVCNGVSCPKCKARLEECREVAYPNGEVYKEFDCVECDFTGRLRKGNLYIDL